MLIIKNFSLNRIFSRKLQVIALHIIFIFFLCCLYLNAFKLTTISKNISENFQALINSLDYYTNPRFIPELPLSNLDNNPISVRAKNGDSFDKILKRQNLTNNEINKIIQQISQFYNPKKIKLDQNFNFIYSTQVNDHQIMVKKLEMIKLELDFATEVIVERLGENQFKSYQIIKKTTPKYFKKTAVIKNNFISTAISLDISSNALSKLIQAYSYEIDFQREIKPGTQLEIYYQKNVTEDGKLSPESKILYSSIKSSNNEYKLYLYNHFNDFDYFNQNGELVKRQLLKTPLNIIRISSSFGMRNHPVLGYSKMHKGIDFSAPIGTPIMASGSGVVLDMGYKGTYGKYIKIKHSGVYSTAYAHLKSYAKKLRIGTKVNQGDIIGYVGNTGRSTGPHLHYEIMVNNKHINPLSLKSAPSIKLAGKELLLFNKFKAELDQSLAAIPNQITSANLE